MREAPVLSLYWCETEDHHEDWFVVARRDGDARRTFAREEGYDEDQVSAKPAFVLPEALQDEKHLGWPARDLLEACGANVVRWENPRVVELEGVRFVEGMLEHQILQVSDDIFELKGRGRPNKTNRDWPS